LFRLPLQAAAGVGYGEGRDFDEMYDHFRDGNAEEFGLLVKLFAGGAANWDTEVSKANASVGAK